MYRIGRNRILQRSQNYSMNYAFRIVDLTLLKDEELWDKLLQLNEGEYWEAIHCFRFIKQNPKSFICAKLVVAFFNLEPIAWCGCFYYGAYTDYHLENYAEMHSCSQHIQCYTLPAFRRKGLQKNMLPILANIAEQFDELEEFEYDAGYQLDRTQSCQNTFKYFTKKTFDFARSSAIMGVLQNECKSSRAID